MRHISAGAHADHARIGRIRGPMQRARPVARVKTGPARSREKERAWAHVPWWHSAIFVVAVVVMAVAVNSGLNSRPSRTAATDGITFRITDAGSGLPLSGATVSIGGQSLTSGVDGTVKVPVAPVEQDVTVQYPGYQTMYGRASANSPSSLDVALLIAPTATATEIPPTPVPPTPTPVALAAGERFRGTVADRDGNPIAGAVVLLGAKYVLTDEGLSQRHRGQLSRGCR